ncbi:GH25 family lysozyme [Paracoccus sp. CPCC 101403]|uniref:GH25 family lysozyme n=2 Tax=Paracoccus broussonetiae TaxID=3075834 RepID=A0ABU3EFA4_9RHOB|nr:GH25 family lysozyme [Paracoccus sp. CPCC 101403]MDT1062921.1 GH25 family lysozyme [Paracoccus sp. CPCC 101403]
MNILGKFLCVVLLVSLAACGGGRRGPSAVTVGYGAGPQFGDSQPHAWVGGHPYDHPVHGIDISRYQGNIDWGRVRGSGVSFAFIKATEGADHADPNFRRYWYEAGQARIPRGAYHYFYFCRSGAQQAAWFIANVPRERGAMPPVIDLEWTASKTCPRRPPSDEVLREAKIFKDILHRHYGQRPIIYTTVDFYRDNNLGSWPEEFWLRSVAGHPRIVYPGQPYSFWQYTGTGIVPGVQGNVDLNVFAGGAKQWRLWLSRRLQ